TGSSARVPVPARWPSGQTAAPSCRNLKKQPKT
ncbi:hypothetical protein A2U01_0117951, partial [Trifolium medium]|nr:hypothetical protein [Trifolium medium]